MITRREIQVLELRKKGLRQNEIAARLKISQPAVSGFLSNALRKIRDSKKTMKLVEELGIEYEEE